MKKSLKNNFSTAMFFKLWVATSILKIRNDRNDLLQNFVIFDTCLYILGYVTSQLWGW